MITKGVSCQISHPNVSIEQTEHPHNLSQSLQPFVKSRLVMNPSRRVGLECILSTVISGLSHLHPHNLGHFDIKTSNILIKWV